jgi:NAD(P)H-dependent FMN reductase
MPQLGVVIASVREGRVGKPIGDWVVDLAKNHGVFQVKAIDLKEIHLPLMEEPKHPRLQQYTHETTRAWSAIVAPIDAFVFVTPEYDFGSPPALVNALIHLYVEWNYKAACFVSYGGVSGGTRSVEMTKQILGALKMVPIVEAVHIPFVTQFIVAESKTFKNTEAHEKAARVMLDELAKWTEALGGLRAQVKT